jgi:threonyl-tRNA synthetase
MQKVNIMVIVGEKEVEDNTLTIRRRFIKQQQTVSLESFTAEILDEIKDRRVPN